MAEPVRFPDGVTRAVLAEVGRLGRPGGLFLFHVNALEDRPLRARWQPARELEADYPHDASAQLTAKRDAMKERASAPGGCWKVRSIRLHQAREAHDDGSI